MNGGSAARRFGQLLWIALALCALCFAAAPVGFLMTTGGQVGRMLVGCGPERAQEAVLDAFGFVVSLLAFATISVPGFWFVAYTARAFWRGETDWTRRYD